MLLSVTSKVLIRIILHRVASVIDPYLRKEQAGFRKGKSWADHFPLRQILEQSNEWITTVNANFIDFAKTFESVHRPEELLKMLMHYAIPNTIISIIQMLYMDFYEKVIWGTEQSESFPIQTGVRQGCLLSPLCIDWLMKTTTRQANRGISWTFQQSLVRSWLCRWHKDI